MCPIASESIRVCYIDRALIRTERNPRGPSQPILDDPDITRSGMIPVDVTRQARSPTKLLFEPVTRVREPQRPIPGECHIVRRVEVPPVESRHQRLGRFTTRHIVQPPRPLCQVSLGAKDDSLRVLRGTRRHGH